MKSILTAASILAAAFQAHAADPITLNFTVKLIDVRDLSTNTITPLSGIQTASVTFDPTMGGIVVTNDLIQVMGRHGCADYVDGVCTSTSTDPQPYLQLTGLGGISATWDQNSFERNVWGKVVRSREEIGNEHIEGHVVSEIRNYMGSQGSSTYTYQQVANYFDVRAYDLFEDLNDWHELTVGPRGIVQSLFRTTSYVRDCAPGRLCINSGYEYRSIVTSVAIAQVPEPSAWALALLGLCFVGGARRLASTRRA